MFKKKTKVQTPEEPKEIEQKQVVSGLKNTKTLAPQQERKQKKKSILHLLNLKNLQSEINGYGYHYSIKSFFIELLIAFAIIFVAGIFCGLNWKPIVILMSIGTILTPYIILEQFRYLYEESRFTNSVNYMTQMIYSFKKTPKILSALEDTQKVVDEKTSILLGYAIDYIKAGKFKEDLYKEALAPIEEEYGCDRMLALHSYMIHVEKVGGEYRNGMDVMLTDLQAWTERTYGYQKDRKNMKLKAIVAIILCIIICALFCNLMPSQFDITHYAVYQISTTVLLGVFIFLFALIQSKLNGSWLVGTVFLKDATVDLYKLQASGGKLKRAYLTSLPLIIALFVGTVHFGIEKKFAYALIFGFILVFSVFYPQLQKKTAKRILRKEFIKTFPDWIRQLSLNLQMQNVYTAIKDTTPGTPYVLRTELEKLLSDIDADPVTIEPYSDFLKGYDIPEITTNMSMIYALNKYGRADAEKQINAIIKRNAKMIEKSEILKNKDEIGLTGFILMSVPELLTVVKMLIDMVLMLMTFLSITQATM